MVAPCIGRCIPMVEPGILSIGTSRIALADLLGWDAGEFLAFTESADAEARYRASTAAAHQRGVFGVPTMLIGEEMWWGNDRLEFLEEFLAAQSA